MTRRLSHASMPFSSALAHQNGKHCSLNGVELRGKRVDNKRRKVLMQLIVIRIHPNILNYRHFYRQRGVGGGKLGECEMCSTLFPTVLVFFPFPFSKLWTN